MRSLKKILMGAIFLCLSTFTCVNGFVDVNAQQENHAMELQAFYPSSAKYSKDIERYIDGCDSVNFAWSRLYEDELTKLSTVKGTHGNKDFYYPDDYLKPVLYAKSRGKSIQLSIYADSGCSVSLLPYEEKRAQAVKTIINVLNKDISKGQAVFYDGIVIDFESLRDKDVKGKDILYNGKHISYYFNTFLSELKEQLDKSGKKLCVAVNPRLYFNGYDYKGIIKAADRMIIMAHDYEPAGKLRKSEVTQYSGYDALNPIDSPAPIRRIRMALEDVRNDITDASDLKRVLLQLCFDCRQWKFDASSIEDWETMDSAALSKGQGGTVYSRIKDRIDNIDGKGSYISRYYNNELQCPVIQYLNNSDKTYNVIVYEDSNSISAKLKAAIFYGLGGISVWSLGNVPDYNDTNGKKFCLDVWNSLQSATKESQSGGKNDNETVSFTDPAIKNAVMVKLGITRDIHISELNDIYRLKLPSGTVSLDDLKLLPNLEYLDVQGISLNDIGALRGLTNLRVLKLQNNKLKDLTPLAGLKKLQILNLSSNGITNITPLGSLNLLEELYLGTNRIEDISALKKAAGLKMLYINDNKITDLSPVASSTGLYKLSVEGNAVKKVTALAGLGRLRYLNLASNKITDISPLKTVKKLNVLYLQRNSIKDVSAIKEMKSMKELSLNGNKLNDIQALSGLKNLEKLYLMDNSITNVKALKNLTKLNTLYLGGNKIKDFSPMKAYFGNLKYCDFKIK